MPTGKNPLFWDEVVSRQAKAYEEAVKDEEYAADAIDDPKTYKKVVKEAKQKQAELLGKKKKK